MSKVILIPGIRAGSPEKQMGALRGSIDSFVPSVYADYGYILIPFNNKWALEAIQEVYEPGDILVGYSNGGYAAWQFCQKGYRPRYVFLISPALERDRTFPVPTTCYYSEGDGALVAGKIWSTVTSIFPWRWGTPHGWGQMGKYGAKSPAIENVEMKECISHKWFNYPKVVNRISDDIRKAY